MTGNANVNLINTSMFGLTDINDGAVSIGLFEFGFGKDGLHSQIGMGGTDLNLGKLASSLNGVSALYQNKKINEYTQTHKDIEANVAMRALFSYGDKNGRDTYEDILSGKTTLAVNDKLEDNATAKTVMNYDGTKTIFLRSLSNNVTEGVAAGIVLQHEAYLDGVDSADQSAEAHAAVTAHTEMAIRVRDDGMYVNTIRNNENLAKDIENYEAGSEAFREYAKKYSSEKDYWKLMKDGSVVFDGNQDLVDEDGKVLKEYEGKGGYTDSLKEVLGISEAQAGEMLKTAGLTYKDGTFKTSKGIDAKNNSDIRLHAPEDATQRLVDTYGNSAWMAQNNYYAGVVDSYKREGHRQEILEHMPNDDYNSAVFSQELVQSVLGIEDQVACCIASDMVINNEYQKQLGNELTNNELLAVASYLKESAFDSTTGKVLDHNLIGSEIMNLAKTDFYLRANDSTTSSLSSLLSSGTSYYLEYRVDTNDPKHTHIMGWYNDYRYDPDTTTDYDWWNDDYLSYPYYRGFTPTRRN